MARVNPNMHALDLQHEFPLPHPPPCRVDKQATPGCCVRQHGWRLHRHAYDNTPCCFVGSSSAAEVHAQVLCAAAAAAMKTACSTTNHASKSVDVLRRFDTSGNSACCTHKHPILTATKDAPERHRSVHIHKVLEHCKLGVPHHGMLQRCSIWCSCQHVCHTQQQRLTCSTNRPGDTYISPSCCRKCKRFCEAQARLLPHQMTKLPEPQLI